MSKALELFMERASIHEDIVNAIKELSSKSLKEILSYALSGELDSTKVYEFLYENLPDGYPREKFKEFIEMERDHDRKVEKIFRALFPGEEPVEVKLKTWSKAVLEKDFRLRTVKDYLKAPEIAMDLEKLSEGVYTMLYDILRNPEHKRIMKKLAEDERYHYNFLRKEYDFYSQIEAEKALKELIRELKGNKGG
ncbi:ferritin family protein [Pyrococcus abyssi]|uniref:Rubrerythrin diiron-binding domain-containing protein n=1 Tax=Pyrococcus abyssi (strain GE5 / Orsay) TaxID=272844 RepID=Q9V026_PYRAB|nr:ferritin family protein [Pyrococcus abyssi]CAB49880.1 Hypothetical protein PAB1727 [Pyrococcus abyssi GE5]CCE70378.1 TPA: hypothetical protein PAB1727 [Pyrococcus abyssi GE5]